MQYDVKLSIYRFCKDKSTVQVSSDLFSPTRQIMSKSSERPKQSSEGTKTGVNPSLSFKKGLYNIPSLQHIGIVDFHSLIFRGPGEITLFAANKL